MIRYLPMIQQQDTGFNNTVEEEKNDNFQIG